jgi:hypothetical protein
MLERLSPSIIYKAEEKYDQFHGRTLDVTRDDDNELCCCFLPFICWRTRSTFCKKFMSLGEKWNSSETVSTLDEELEGLNTSTNSGKISLPEALNLNGSLIVLTTLDDEYCFLIVGMGTIYQ